MRATFDSLGGFREASFRVLVLVACLSAFGLGAADLDEGKVRIAAENWVRHVTADARPDATVEQMEPYQMDGTTVAYVVHLAGGGFCVAGADSLVLPVYLYSPTGNYDPQNPACRFVLNQIGIRLAALRSALAKNDPGLQVHEDALARRALLWADLTAGRVPSRGPVPKGLSDPVMLELPLTCKWDQTPPYNDQCPAPTGSGTHALVGCGATAIAQIMYYWKWPMSGEGSESVAYDSRGRTDWDEDPLATNPKPEWGSSSWNRPIGGGILAWTSASGGRLRMTGYWDETSHESAEEISTDSSFRDALDNLWDRLLETSVDYEVDFSAAIYDWSLMQDVHGEPPDPGDVEVAKLSFHAGVALGMDYGMIKSGVWSGWVDNALGDHFRYDTDATHNWSIDINAMVQEIQWLRPLILRGKNVEGEGHIWVVYGYNKGTDPNRQFKMNMGWGGSSDGWYSVDQVPLGLFLNEEQVIQIAPRDVVRFVGASDGGDGSPDDAHQDIEEAIISAPDGATLIFKAGSDNTFIAPSLTINRPLTLKGIGVTIRRQ